MIPPTTGCGSPSESAWRSIGGNGASWRRRSARLPATLLTAGLLVRVVGVVAVAGLFAGFGLSLTALGRDLPAGR